MFNSLRLILQAYLKNSPKTIENNRKCSSRYRYSSPKPKRANIPPPAPAPNVQRGGAYHGLFNFSFEFLKTSRFHLHTFCFIKKLSHIITEKLRLLTSTLGYMLSSSGPVLPPPIAVLALRHGGNQHALAVTGTWVSRGILVETFCFSGPVHNGTLKSFPI